MSFGAEKKFTLSKPHWIYNIFLISFKLIYDPLKMSQKVFLGT